MTRVAMLAFWCALGGLPTTQQAAPSPSETQAVLDQARPGPEHASLEALEGRWTREVTLSMGGGQQMKARGTATNRMILGGRFLQSDQSTSFPASTVVPATTTESMTIYGFDKRTREFTVLELDTMGTYWVTASGPRTAAPAIVMSGETLEDHGGRREIQRYDMVLRIVDADTYVTQIIFKFDRAPALTLLEAVHRRIK